MRGQLGLQKDVARILIEAVCDSIKRAITAIVSIEPRADPVERMLSLEEQVLVRQQFELELGLARLGLVSRQADLFGQSLSAATDLLNRHFDTTEVAVESALALLTEMREIEIAPERPDISGSLSMLRALADRED